MKTPITIIVTAAVVAMTCSPAKNPRSSGDEAAATAGYADPAGRAPAANGGVMPAADGGVMPSANGGVMRAAGDAHDHAGHTAPPAAPAVSERSLHLLPATWTDQNGDELALADLGGRVQVVAMVYTHCTFACPRILAQMKQIEGRVDADPRVGFVIVSIDPERDTPARLAEFAESARLDPERWTLLNGADVDVQTLSVLLGVKYQATTDGEFAHSNVLTVLNPGGEIVHRVEGLGADLDPAVATVRELAKDLPPADHVTPAPAAGPAPHGH